ncbi:DNA alkylation repair protein [Candidatus Bathycorpusculum sp.]|uniref:DNA alkylation repair protein n=1 Tax=Candidatus Bathycorpusculum sp. TaxID=2994959 RepID=UPI002817704B|nr:DNA alkylation repair protein [Candidatus Termitimicrobium sp.]MCL2685639.1 DNA alkylation repair protein [Candidatus Termitimicrobium sp.]
MSQIIAQLREELKANADPQTQEGAKRYFKEPIITYGVKNSTTHQISCKNWTNNIKNLSKPEIFALCETLLSSGVMEEAFVAAEWLPKIVDQFQPDDLITFERWIDTYIDNWAKCDTFCNHTVGDFMMKFPQQVGTLMVWAKSPNRWLRRAAAVTLIVPAKKGLFLDESLKISDLLLTDTDDLVQKGYGWLLKAQTEKHPTEILAYVIKNKSTMPRTALRYAIEKLPKEQKTQAMKKA